MEMLAALGLGVVFGVGVGMVMATWLAQRPEVGQTAGQPQPGESVAPEQVADLRSEWERLAVPEPKRPNPTESSY